MVYFQYAIFSLWELSNACIYYLYAFIPQNFEQKEPRLTNWMPEHEKTTLRWYVKYLKLLTFMYIGGRSKKKKCLKNSLIFFTLPLKNLKIFFCRTWATFEGGGHIFYPTVLLWIKCSFSFATAPRLFPYWPKETWYSPQINDKVDNEKKLFDISIVSKNSTIIMRFCRKSRFSDRIHSFLKGRIRIRSVSTRIQNSVLVKMCGFGWRRKKHKKFK